MPEMTAIADYPRLLRECGSYNVICESADYIERIEARLTEAERLVLQLPCGCINLGDGEYAECDRCRFLHGTADREAPVT